jgi:hypothetical protein
MLNFPKTGSSFARTIIKRVCHNRETIFDKIGKRLFNWPGKYEELFFEKQDKVYHYNLKGQHGTYRQIPKRYLNRKILSITRNPFSRYVSTYLYGWWKKYPPGPMEIIKEFYPNYPELTFNDYYEMIHSFGIRDRLGELPLKCNIGMHTLQFIQFYSKSPSTVLSEISNNKSDYLDFKKIFPEICFLRQEKLNSDLKDFLKNCGYHERELSFIDSVGKINVTNKSQRDENYMEYYSDKLISKINERDKLLFNIFPFYRLEIK